MIRQIHRFYRYQTVPILTCGLKESKNIQSSGILKNVHFLALCTRLTPIFTTLSVIRYSSALNFRSIGVLVLAHH